MIKRELIKRLNQHKIFSPSQHGFLEKHSTYSNLLEAAANWTRNIDKKTGTLVAYVDFQKALDEVSFLKSLHKLEHEGKLEAAGSWSTWKLLECISSLSYGRTLRVKVNVLSDIVHLISGVPQVRALGSIRNNKHNGFKTFCRHS